MFLGRMATRYGTAHLVLSLSLLGQTAAPGRDSSAFVAVVRTIVADSEFSRGGAIAVDPRPLIMDEATAERPTPTRMRISSRDLTARLHGLRSLGVAVGDAKRRASCAGTMMPYSPKTYHKGCPREARQVASISLLRAVRESASSPAHWIALVAVTHTGPYGFNSLVYEYTLSLHNAGWIVSKGHVVAFRE